MRRFIFTVLLVGLLCLAILRSQRGGGLFHRAGPEKFTAAAGPVLDLKDVQVLAAMDAEQTRLVQSVVPSVVSIATARKVRVPLVDPFDFLFGRRRVTERTENALGSGVIVSQEGHILTNHHVIANMQEIRVQLTDGRILPAQLIGTDEAVDIAVLQVNAANLTPLPFGDSDQVRVGQMVFAVGNPFGLQETVTRGIVSAKGRALRDSGVEFLQTDAAVNPGNSGGPLLDVHGQVIGINSAIFSQTGGWAGISFAIPSNVARTTMQAILKNGRPVRGYLGLNMMSLNPPLAQQFRVPDTQGALIADVVPGSPAENAGLKPGDVVRKFNGKEVANATALRDLIAGASIGTKVELEILRYGQQGKTTLEITQMPAGVSAPQTAPATAPQSS
jgi:serine protease Do